MVYRDGKPAFEEISQNTITVKMLNWSQHDGSTRADHKISENEIFKSHLPSWRIGWQVATEVVPESLVLINTWRKLPSTSPPGSHSLAGLTLPSLKKSAPNLPKEEEFHANFYDSDWGR